jgi:hypothetical protein
LVSEQSAGISNEMRAIGVQFDGRDCDAQLLQRGLLLAADALKVSCRLRPKDGSNMNAARAYDALLG